MIIRQTTKELLAASLQELAQNKSIDKITIREIAQNCQLTSTTFYNHFQDKYALLAWIYHRELTPLYEHLGKDIDWNTLIRQGIIAVQQNKQFYRNALSSHCLCQEPQHKERDAVYSVYGRTLYIYRMDAPSGKRPQKQLIVFRSKCNKLFF